MSQETKFAEHIYFERPKEGRPDFVKGTVSMKRDEAVKFLQSLPTSEKGYIYLELLASKDNSKLYFKVDEWHQRDKQSNDTTIDESGIPF